MLTSFDRSREMGEPEISQKNKNRQRGIWEAETRKQTQTEREKRDRDTERLHFCFGMTSLVNLQPDKYQEDFVWLTTPGNSLFCPPMLYILNPFLESNWSQIRLIHTSPSSTPTIEWIHMKNLYNLCFLLFSLGTIHFPNILLPNRKNSPNLSLILIP